MGWRAAGQRRSARGEPGPAAGTEGGERMASLGERLRAARQHQGLTLAEAERATKIRQRYLEALEEEDYGALPPTVHTIGFLRCYASYLGLDVDAAVRAFYRETGIRESPDIQPEARPLRHGFYLGPQMVTGSIILVVLLGLGVYVWNQVQVFTSKSQPTATLVAGLPSQPPIGASLPPITAPVSTPGPGANFGGTNGVTVELRVVDRPTFLRVYEDEEKKFQGTVEPGQLLPVFRGAKEVYLQAGDAGSIEITLNGRKFPDRLGPRGVTMDRVLSAPGR